VSLSIVLVTMFLAAPVSMSGTNYTGAFRHTQPPLILSLPLVNHPCSLSREQSSCHSSEPMILPTPRGDPTLHYSNYTLWRAFFYHPYRRHDCCPQLSCCRLCQGSLCCQSCLICPRLSSSLLLPPTLLTFKPFRASPSLIPSISSSISSCSFHLRRS
jgi:hypothetical protein